MQEKILNSDLFADKIFKKIINALWEYRHVILGSLLMGLLAYGYMFANKIPNHDDITALFSKGTTYASGRWGLRLLSLIFPDASMPWLNGILSLALLAFGNCMVVKLFKIKSPVLQFLLGGVVVTFPSQIGTFGYMFTAVGYAVAYCLAVGAALLLSREKKQFFGAGICYVLSLSIYQAYLSITASILILHLIQAVLEEKKSIKEIIIRGLWYVAFLVAGLGLYWVSAKAVWILTKTQMGAYANNALAFDIRYLPQGIYNAYVYYGKTLLEGYKSLIPTGFSRLFHWGCFGLAAVELVAFGIKCKNKKKLILLAFLLLLLPLGINCMFLFVTVRSIHTLVLFSFAAVYILLAILVEKGQGRKWKAKAASVGNSICLNALVVLLAAILLCNAFTANKAYLKMQLSYENTYAFASTLLAQLQAQEGYRQDSKVAIVGTYDVPDFYKMQFADATGIMGTDIITPTTYSIDAFFTYYMGVDLNMVTEAEGKALMESDQFAQMESYPNYGCMEKIGDVFVIKLSQ